MKVRATSAVKAGIRIEERNKMTNYHPERKPKQPFKGPNENIVSMCKECFRIAAEYGFPKKILDRYKKRKNRFYIERKPRGEIAHFRFFHQKGNAKQEWWKGVEFCTFWEDGRTEYRVCYWANLGRGKGWRWGQYATFFPPELWRDVSDYIRDHEDGKP